MSPGERRATPAPEAAGAVGASAEGGRRPGARARANAAAAVLVAVTLAAHGNTLANGFVWDDKLIVVDNPQTRDLSRLGEVVLSPDVTPPYYRPLSRATYLLEYQLYGLDPRGFHAVNVALQVACVLALYALARRLLGAPGAFVAASLLAVHPVGVEAVAFVAARNNLLALLFSLVALALFVDAEREDDGRKAVLSGVALFLGLLSKEPAAMTLGVVAVWLVLARRDGTLRRGARLLAPHGVAAGAYLVLRAISLGGLVATSPSAVRAPLGERLAANLLAVPEYLALLLFPRDLTTYRLLPSVEPVTVAWSLLAWLALAGGSVALVRRGSRAAQLGLAWFLLGLLPVANVVSLPTATVLADRYVFIPAVGLWLVAGDLFDAAWRRPRLRGGLVAAAGAALLALGARTVVRNRDWKDDLTLARAAVEVEPDAPMARYNLGMALERRGDRAGALEQWEAAARLDRIDGRAHVALGNVAAERGDVAAAETHYGAALPMLVGPVEARLNLGKLYDRAGDPRRARQQWEAVLRAEPGHADALAQLGALDAAAGDLPRAEAAFRGALRADPEMREALFNMGLLCELTGRPAEALAFYARFLRAPGPADDPAVRRVTERIRLLESAR